MAIMPNTFAAPPLASLGIGFDTMDPESLIILGLGKLEDIYFSALNAGGPLDGLISPPNNPNSYDFRALRYPYDIEHMFMHGHYINFFINVPVFSKYYEPKDGGKNLPPLPNGESYTWYDKRTKGFFKDDDLTQWTGAGDGLNLMRNQRISQAISLYIPDSMSFASGINYENTDAFSQGKKALEAIDKGLGTKFLDNRVSKIVGMLGKLGSAIGGPAGFAFNEQLLVIFRGMSLREFTYDFYFTPRSEAEAKNVQNIIKTFRFHAHPELVDGYGMFYISPGTFDIEFMHRGERNTCVHQVKTCVLTNYSVDYAPMGWSTHEDGMPVQTRMTLSFKETAVITKEEINKGF